MTFIADAMLGRLARWLRLLGFDVLYDASWDDATIARAAAAGGRVVLTRDHALLQRRLVREGLLVDSDDLGAQLRQVLRFTGPPDPALMFSRCAVCNTPVVPASAAEVAGTVPPFVLRHRAQFVRCTGCGRVYWPGTHRERALAELRRMIGAPENAPL
ncbi:MAG: Mut7-C RNAse domain-containing protein [Acidobacteria bacterium]|nr:Mut7-C RNAse domain-containing protein [Acidobacteriota bacterium]